MIGKAVKVWLKTTQLGERPVGFYEGDSDDRGVLIEHDERGVTLRVDHAEQPERRLRWYPIERVLCVDLLDEPPEYELCQCGHPKYRHLSGTVRANCVERACECLKFAPWKNPLIPERAAE